MKDGKSSPGTERGLINYRATVEGRDDLVVHALDAGLTKHRIHVLSGISRSTIDRIIDGRDAHARRGKS